MSFSASTCLTNTGTATLGPSLYVYSNPVSPTNSGTYVTTVPTSDITGGNCPYVLILPDGTTSIRLFDPIGGCYCDIVIDSNDLCTTCDINFNTYSPVNVGNIVVGDVTGSCDTTITDYKISWYETGDTVNAVFTSGNGTMFAPYDYVHPLTGTSAVLAPSGTYEAILDEIELNGVIFSRNGEPGTVLADLDCLPSVINGNPIEVDALNCNNGDGSSDLSQYVHRFAYSATTGGATPIPLRTSFELSAGTKYFPWKFKGFTIPDKLKLTFSGSAYSVPITLEYWEIGQTNVTNYNYDVFPKSASTTDFFSKVTVLTGLTVNEGDNILIEVTPSTANTQTSWTFYCGCLDDFDCSMCLPPALTMTGGQTTYTYKISASTITATTSFDGCSVSPKMTLSGCSINSITGSSIYQYLNFNTGLSFGSSSNPLISRQSTDSIFLNRVTCNLVGTGQSPTCENLGSGVNITYTKTSGLFRIESNSPIPIQNYYTGYTSTVTPWLTPFSGDSTNPAYYRGFYLNYTLVTGTTPCGDGTPEISIFFHISSIMTSGTTGGGDYFIQFTMPTITDGISFNTCDTNCDYWSTNVVNWVNPFSTGSTYNSVTTTNVGAFRRNPVIVRYFNVGSPSSSTATTFNASWTINRSQITTVPASGATYIPIPSFSGNVCPSISAITNYSSINTTQIARNRTYEYEWVCFDPTDLTTLENNYRIYAYQINQKGNVVYPYVKDLVYEVTSGVVTYSNPIYLV